MRTRFLLLGTLVGTIVLFVWQAIANAAIPWYQRQMKPFKDPAAAVNAIRAQAPENGVYIEGRGVFAVVSFKPDMHDQTADMGPMLAKEAALDVVVAIALCLLIERLPLYGPATTAATLGLAAGMVTLVVVGSNSIWYGFPDLWTLVSVIDETIAFALAGAAVRAVWRRTRLAESPGAVAGVRAEGGLSTAPGGVGTRA